jgi:hypothetical protein
LGKRGYLPGFAFSPDGRYLVAAQSCIESHPFFLCIWDLERNIELYYMTELTWSLGKLAISPDGRWIAYADRDRIGVRGFSGVFSKAIKR